MERRVIKVSNKKEFSVKVYVNENKQETNLLKDLDKEQYTLIIGKKDANKPFKRLLEIKTEIIKQIQQEYPNKEIKVTLI
jgi:hypothetical protein